VRKPEKKNAVGKGVVQNGEPEKTQLPRSRKEKKKNSKRRKKGKGLRGQRTYLCTGDLNLLKKGYRSREIYGVARGSQIKRKREKRRRNPKTRREN